MLWSLVLIRIIKNRRHEVCGSQIHCANGKYDSSRRFCMAMSSSL